MQPDSTTEEWRSVTGYEGWYSISNLGRVRRDRPYATTTVGRILCLALNRKGYPCVSLSKQNASRTATVHLLVARAFIGPRPAGHQANHRDGVKANNCVTNLEYVTPSQNVKHSYEMGLASNKGELHPSAKLTDALVRYIRASAASHHQLAEELGFSYHTIWDVRHRSWQHI